MQIRNDWHWKLDWSSLCQRVHGSERPEVRACMHEIKIFCIQAFKAGASNPFHDFCLTSKKVHLWLSLIASPIPTRSGLFLWNTCWVPLCCFLECLYLLNVGKRRIETTQVMKENDQPIMWIIITENYIYNNFAVSSKKNCPMISVLF